MSTTKQRKRTPKRNPYRVEAEYVEDKAATAAAQKAREACNKLSEKERQRLLRKGWDIIYAARRQRNSPRH